MTVMKTCIRCKKEKPLIEFYVYNRKISSKCRECHKQAQKEYRQHQPELKEERRRRYIKDSLKTGMRYRVGLKYVLDSPTGDLKKCTRCKNYQPRANYGKDKNAGDGKRTICKQCVARKRRETYIPKPPRKRKSKEEIREHDRHYMRTYNYLQGDGCCLYCWETNPFMLNNHHPWKKKDPKFTVTLCENHHAPFTRKLFFILTQWAP